MKVTPTEVLADGRSTCTLSYARGDCVSALSSTESLTSDERDEDGKFVFNLEGTLLDDTAYVFRATVVDSRGVELVTGPCNDRHMHSTNAIRDTELNIVSWGESVLDDEIWLGEVVARSERRGRGERRREASS